MDCTQRHELELALHWEIYAFTKYISTSRHDLELTLRNIKYTETDWTGPNQRLPWWPEQNPKRMGLFEPLLLSRRLISSRSHSCDYHHTAARNNRQAPKTRGLRFISRWYSATGSSAGGARSPPVPEDEGELAAGIRGQRRRSAARPGPARPNCLPPLPPRRLLPLL